MIQVRKAVLQTRMALDVLITEPGRPCAIITAECCIYIPDYDKNTTGLLTGYESSNWCSYIPSIVT